MALSKRKIRKEDALAFHEHPRPGKIEVVPTKALSSQHDLALAYSPGVAEPCKAIAQRPEDAYRYTSKGNLVGVISNGTAVLGLGNIGAQASKPVMEGKAVLFKKFAGIDVFDIEIDSQDPDEFIRTVKLLEPTFGAVNLEDIKAPECFYIEQQLRKQMNIPVMHDDQHGTAIITSAALLNALELVGKKIDEIKLVVLGAGAAAMACTRFYVYMGVRVENLVMIDINGVLRKDTVPPDDVRYQFATDRDVHNLQEALDGADMLLGLATGNIVKPEDLQRMAPHPIVFALSNPEPEINYDLAMSSRPDLIMATGRSDHPNQVNNVLGFPYIFRGALDVSATEINEEMKLAAVKALAELAKEVVPDQVNRAYEDNTLGFGRGYLIPKPLDPRLITTVAPAVARAAMETGVARRNITDWDAYDQELLGRVGSTQKLISQIVSRAKRAPKRVIFAEADNYKILKAAQILIDEGIALPILLGNRTRIAHLIQENRLELEDSVIIDPMEEDELCTTYGAVLYEKRKRKGVTPDESVKLMRDRNYFGAAMLELNEADVLISGLTKDYRKTIRPALQVIGVKKHVNRVAGMYIVNSARGAYFFADTTVNANPSAEELVDIIGLTANAVRFFDTEPRIALLSYSNFGSAPGYVPEKMAFATQLAQEKYPDLQIEGEMQANIALNTDLQRENYPFSCLAETGANTLIFPDLASGNIAYKLLQEMGGADVIGPILIGMQKPVHILQLGSSVREIVNMAAIAVADAQYEQARQKSLSGEGNGKGEVRKTARQPETALKDK
ncbi:malate dehydrogenase (oxaloacetate-decarboxylating)(NADP+) [Catalinimonas alkaloidigena]|uniref:Malate dehydrogenase (Oxaloacetate-decarboxylating)(NADP+) n=1 Tax=Catalinimonas alkaloidigena TaxID=1075417 RepID=A0A1G9DDW2_9BACT|nr:NADP-dependent malic enzyme [Catalinimonas alkaloidigena]SDK62055.1 malate dehydrogenase (oxaloacetate-decarboxylating)(NADP+) [Catalinimonas alkaloidigena]